MGASEKEVRDQALSRAEDSLDAATHPAREPTVPIESLVFTPEDAVARARTLSDEAAGLLRDAEPEVGRAQSLLEEALGLIEHVLIESSKAR
jgi:hypothetical protein